MKVAYRRYIVWASAWFTAWYVLALVFWPHQSTISYLGTMKPTILQYAVALAGTAYFIWRAANEMSKNHAFRTTSKLLKWFAVLLFTLPLVPYTVSDVVFWLHMTILGCLLILAGTVCVQIAIISRSKTVFLLLALQAVGVAMFAYTFNMDRADFLWRMQFAYELLCIASLLLILHIAADYFD